MREPKDHTFIAVLVMVLLGAYATILIFITKYSRDTSLCLIWVPIVITGTYLIGKRAGRGEQGCRRKNSSY